MNLRPEDIKSMIERRAAPFPDELTREALREAQCWERVCLLPNDFNERLSYLGDVLVQATCGHPKDDQLRATVGTLCQALSYLLNSCSWLEGVLHDFDRDELERKLKRFL